MRRLYLGLFFVLALAKPNIVPAVKTTVKFNDDESWCIGASIETKIKSAILKMSYAIEKLYFVPAVKTTMKLSDNSWKMSDTTEKPNFFPAAIKTTVQFIDATWKMSDTIEKAATFAKQLKFLSGALGVLAVFGSNADSARHRQVMNEFAKVHNGIAKLREEISFLEANMELQHMKTRLFNAFEVLRQAMRLSSFSLRVQLVDYCHRNQCYHALEQLTRHAPELLEAYIKVIGPEQDYVPMVAAYAHRLVSIVGKFATIIRLSIEDVNEDYIGLEEMSKEINGLLEKSKTNWSRIYANIKLDAKTLMQQGNHLSTKDVLLTLQKGLRPKYPWMSLGILVYNDIWSTDRHYITGHRVDVFHESGKNVVVFVKIKSHDSFKGGKIGKCPVKCKSAGSPAKRCRVREVRGVGVDDTATIKRGEGLWFSMPSDFNYCYINNRHFTNIAIKM